MVQSQRRILQWTCGFQKYASAEVSLIPNRLETGYRRNQSVGVKSEWDMGACVFGLFRVREPLLFLNLHFWHQDHRWGWPCKYSQHSASPVVYLQVSTKGGLKKYILEGSKMQTLNLPLPSNCVLTHRTYTVFTGINTVLHIVRKLEMTEFIWEDLPRLCENTAPFYMRPLTIWGFWCPWGPWSQSPEDIKWGLTILWTWESCPSSHCWSRHGWCNSTNKTSFLGKYQKAPMYLVCAFCSSLGLCKPQSTGEGTPNWPILDFLSTSMTAASQ